MTPLNMRVTGDDEDAGSDDTTEGDPFNEPEDDD